MDSQAKSSTRSSPVLSGQGPVWRGLPPQAPLVHPCTTYLLSFIYLSILLAECCGSSGGADPEEEPPTGTPTFVNVEGMAGPSAPASNMAQGECGACWVPP